MKKKIHNLVTAFMLFISASLLPILLADDAYGDNAWVGTNANVNGNSVQFDYRGGSATFVTTVPESSTVTIEINNTIANCIGNCTPRPDNWTVSINDQAFSGNAIEVATVSAVVSGQVIITATGIDNGFWAGWYGPIISIVGISSPPPPPPPAPVFPANSVMGTVDENGVLTLNAPSGSSFTSVLFASYGTPVDYRLGECHASNSVAIVQAAINNNLLSISADNGVFGDPCGGTYKRLSVVLAYDLVPSPQPTETATPVASPSPSPSATPEMTPEPSPSPSPQQSESPSPAPVEITPSPTASPEATPSSSPTPTPQPEPTPTPQPSPSPAPSPEPAPQPTPEPVPAPRPDPVVVPKPDPAPEPPAVEPEPDPVPEPPAVEPEPPVVEPEPPAVEPEPPAVEPEPPAVEPEPPVVEPEPPVVAPEPPAIEPEPPVVEPLPKDDKPLPKENGLIPNSPDSLPETEPKLPPQEALKPHIQVDKAGVENGGIEFFGTKSQPQVIGEDGQLTPPPPPPGSGLPIPPDAVTTTETFIGQAGGVTFNSPDIAVPVEPIELNIEIPGVGEAAQALANTYVAMANIGNDMSPITRKKAKKILIATLVVGQIANLRRM